jgi:hypothetical protein
MAKVGFPLGLSLLFLFCNGFFPFFKKKERKNTKIKMHWRLGWSDFFFGRNFRTSDKKKALETSTQAFIGKKMASVY